MVIASQRLVSRLATSSFRRQAFAQGRRIVGKRSVANASAADIQAWKDRGVLDEYECTTFTTLHEMQVHSCEVYSKNQLFGTFTESSQKFEWMTFGEFADKVDQCRTVLKDLGTSLGGVSNCRQERRNMSVNSNTSLFVCLLDRYHCG